MTRWGPLQPQNWPQDVNRVPNTAGAQMPAISQSNAERDRRESFTYTGTWTIPPGSTAMQNFPLYIATDPDGDFWCDQIAMVGWFSSLAVMQRPPPSLISIADARTGRALTYPRSIPTNFLTTLLLFSEDAGFQPGGSPYPDGFRSTGTLPQPFCFTRAGGISLVLTVIPALLPPDTTTIDIAFGGWKEYERAST